MSTTNNLPSGPPGPMPAIVHVTVGTGGQITSAPETFGVHHVLFKNIVVWVVKNECGEPLSVTIGKFLRKDKPKDRHGRASDPVEAVDWLVSDTLKLEIGGAGLLGGPVPKDYHAKGLIDYVSYTIRVTGNSFDIEWDPDGEIKP